MPKLKIAVVGSGVSGLSCAWALSQRHDVSLIDGDSRIGGHAHTVTVSTSAGPVAVDTGFIVFQRVDLPEFHSFDGLSRPICHANADEFLSFCRGRTL